MKPFVQFMTIENLRVFIDPQAIVAFCEFKFRENDIGLVGTRIDFCIGDKITNIIVRDPIDYVSDALQVGYDNCPDGLPLHQPKSIDIPALNETLICNKEPDPVLTKNLDNFRQAMQEKGAKAAQVRSDAVLANTPQQVAYDTETVAKNLAKILQQPDSRLDFETDTKEKSFNWSDYRPLERGEKIYPSDRTKMNERISLHVQSELVGKSFSLKEHPQVYRQYVFQPGDTVQHIHAYDEPIYKVIKTVEDLAGHLYCVLEGRKQSVRVRELVLANTPVPPPTSYCAKDLQVRPTPTTYRTPPQETPPVLKPLSDPKVGENFIIYTPGEIPTCNGNGEAQSTEE
jgi:hypothetical protein